MKHPAPSFSLLSEVEPIHSEGSNDSTVTFPEKCTIVCSTNARTKLHGIPKALTLDCKWRLLGFLLSSTASLPVCMSSINCFSFSTQWVWPLKNSASCDKTISAVFELPNPVGTRIGAPVPVTFTNSWNVQWSVSWLLSNYVCSIREINLLLDKHIFNSL